ncbi:acyl-CoA synthetase (AMP-forming)/AMP-acid ligase II [Streptomyces sp. 846.5]|nr:AMP-binding protein [Streptomyces sp. 846.5]TDU04452.1 acyl-CoA synthetase (AMP-forming)/AMP-acid ligase II [Streptomyces sp. 846.5]
MKADAVLLHDLLDRAAEQWPGQVAVTAGSVVRTYTELQAASFRLAGWMADAGMSRGSRFVVGSGAAALIPSLVHAASRIGAVFCVLHDQVRGGQLDYVLSDCTPILLISDAAEAREAAAARGIAAVSSAFVQGMADLADAPPLLSSEPPLSVDPVCLIYTSGTTARPKAVVTTHAQLLFAVQAIQSVLCYRSEDVVLNPLPLSFDYGLYQLFLAAAAGAQVRLCVPGETGPRLLETVNSSGATVLASVPSTAEMLVRLLNRGSRRKPALRLLTNTGAAMPGEILDALREAVPALRIQLMFGLTECKRATVMPVDGDLERPGSCGLPLPGTEVFAVGEEGQRLQPGRTGEIVVRGPHVMTGYWNDPVLTAARFHRADGLFPELRTGDYGWIDDAGYLYFTGRRDDLYKEDGYRISALEVEASARAVPGVRSAAVLGPAAIGSAVLFVTGDITASAVLALMRRDLEDFKVPRYCVVLPELPLTFHGKVDRAALNEHAKRASHAAC